MKKFAQFFANTSSSKVRTVLFLLSLVLFILGSGAPEAGGGIITRMPIGFGL